MGFNRKPIRDEDFKVRGSDLLIYKILVAANNPLGVHKCTTSQNSKIKETIQENRASLSETASSDPRITSTTLSATLVQVLPRVNNTAPMQIPYNETRRTLHSKRRYHLSTLSHHRLQFRDMRRMNLHSVV